MAENWPHKALGVAQGYGDLQEPALLAISLVGKITGVYSSSVSAVCREHFHFKRTYISRLDIFGATA